MNEEILEKLIKARKELRRKLRSIKNDKDDENRGWEDTFKPITKPLQTFIEITKNEHTNPKIKKEYIKEDIKYDTKFKPEKFPIKFDASTPKKDFIHTQYEKNTNNDMISENDETLNLNDSNEDEFYSEVESLENENSKNNTANNNTTTAFNLSALGRNDELDTLYGPHKDSFGGWKFGNSNIKFNDDDKITIGNQIWSLTPGLFELLFHKTPRNYDKTELSIYKKILMNTNAHKRDYKIDGQIKGTKAFKYKTILKKLFKDKKSVLITSQNHQGRGLMHCKTSETNYIYWNDPNELVDRLRLLVAAQAPGHNNHDKEIAAIIESLRKNNFIH